MSSPKLNRLSIDANMYTKKPLESTSDVKSIACPVVESVSRTAPPTSPLCLEAAPEVVQEVDGVVDREAECDAPDQQREGVERHARASPSAPSVTITGARFGSMLSSPSRMFPIIKIIRGAITRNGST